MIEVVAYRLGVGRICEGEAEWLEWLSCSAYAKYLKHGTVGLPCTLNPNAAVAA